MRLYHLELVLAALSLLCAPSVTQLGTQTSGIWSDDFATTTSPESDNSNWYVHNVDVGSGFDVVNIVSLASLNSTAIPQQKYHGPIGGHGKTLFRMRRNFYCTNDATVYISFGYAFCLTNKADDYVAVFELDSSVSFRLQEPFNPSGAPRLSVFEPNEWDARDGDPVATTLAGISTSSDSQQVDDHCDSADEWEWQRVDRLNMGERSSNIDFEVMFEVFREKVNRYTLLFDIQLECIPITDAPTTSPTTTPTTSPTTTPTISPTNCNESAIAQFDWETMTESGAGAPEVVDFTMSVDESDLSLNILAALTYTGQSSASEYGELLGTTYVLDFEDFEAHGGSIASPGTCQNRNSEDFTGAFSTWWDYPLSPDAVGNNASYLAYPPPNPVFGEWTVAMDDADPCGVVVYRGKFGWNDLVACSDSEQNTQYVTVTDDAEGDSLIRLQGTFYINVVSPLTMSSTDSGFYRVYQLMSQPFVMSVRKHVEVLGSAGVSVLSVSVIAVYKEGDASLFKLVVMTESFEYLQLSRSGLEAGLVAFQSSSAENSVVQMTSFSVAETAVSGGCLNNNANICSQLWEIESPGDCSSEQSQYIDFSGDYTLQFVPQCRAASELANNGTALREYCQEWVASHPDLTEGGVGLTATLSWRDDNCDPLLFDVQFEADMLVFVDADFSQAVSADTLFQVGEDRVYIEIDAEFPDDTYDVFDTQLLNVWVCTFDPLSGPTLPIVPGEFSGGCFSQDIDGFSEGEANLYAYHIHDAQSTVAVPSVVDFISYGHPTTLDEDKDKVRFSFVVPPTIVRDTLYIHAQIEVSLAGEQRRRLQSVDAQTSGTANQMAHFLSDVSVSTPISEDDDDDDDDTREGDEADEENEAPFYALHLLAILPVLLGVYLQA